MKNITVFTILLIYFSSCYKEKPFSKAIEIQDSYFIGEASIEKIEKINRYKLTIVNHKTGESDRIYTPYEIFQMEAGDMNHDGRTDLCIGIIKPTPFDSILKKRLFIFQIDRDYIRPLWLSSRLVRPLEKFVICKESAGKNIIRTIEIQNEDVYCINEYQWESFGMSFTKVCSDSLSFSDADALINNMQQSPKHTLQ